MLNSAISNDEVTVEGFSSDILRSDHPSDARMGGTCIFYHDGLPLRRRSTFELLQEMVVAEIHLSNKKIFVITLYRSPSQHSETFFMVHR